METEIEKYPQCKCRGSATLCCSSCSEVTTASSVNAPKSKMKSFQCLVDRCTGEDRRGRVLSLTAPAPAHRGRELLQPLCSLICTSVITEFSSLHIKWKVSELSHRTGGRRKPLAQGGRVETSPRGRGRLTFHTASEQRQKQAPGNW